jgi:osmotically-inducible protein OsmY
MDKAAALLIAPTGARTGDESDAVQASAPLLTQSLEDHHLAERVARALHGTGYGPLRSIEVAVHARVVILVGQVPSYYLKQVAQTTVLAVPGAHQVRNDLDVGRPT